jgi:hypothetical protein
MDELLLLNYWWDVLDFPFNGKIDLAIYYNENILWFN